MKERTLRELLTEGIGLVGHRHASWGVLHGRTEEAATMGGCRAPTPPRPRGSAWLWSGGAN